jgi:outer membrane protein insertion porin family
MGQQPGGAGRLPVRGDGTAGPSPTGYSLIYDTQQPPAPDRGASVSRSARTLLGLAVYPHAGGGLQVREPGSGFYRSSSPRRLYPPARRAARASTGSASPIVSSGEPQFRGFDIRGIGPRVLRAGYWWRTGLSRCRPTATIQGRCLVVEFITSPVWKSRSR